MTKLDMTSYTLSSNPEIVAVRKFRNRIARLERKLNVDRHSCVTATERQVWVEEARAAGRALIGTSCKRAIKADWDRRERAIDMSTTLILDWA